MSFFADHLLSYSPVVNAKRIAFATRLQIRRTDDKPCDVAAAYRAISTASEDCPDTMLLSLDEIDLSNALLATHPSEGVWLELPGNLVDTVEGKEWVSELAGSGFNLALRGYPSGKLPSSMIESFKLALVDCADDRRDTKTDADPDTRKIPTAITGVRTIEMMEQSFKAGATAIIGWPLDDADQRKGPVSNAASFSSVSRLLSLINAGAEPEAMEKVIAADPTLAFRLFRYLNSPGFGLSVEIRSFEHAMMMLGQKRMKKWLALLLATASPEANLNPLMFASVRRGFMLQKLVSEFHEPDAQDEAFIIGIFSMLDKLFCEPFDQLFSRLQIPEAVHEALVENSGPAMPYLNLAKAMEGSTQAVRSAQDDAFITPADCNAVLMASLTDAAQAQQAA